MRYAQIRNLDISNGEGVGISIFVQGCKFHCEGCFNKETWDFNGGKEWTEEVENKFLELASRPYIKRISILGGEPLAEENVQGVLSLTQKIHALYPEKTIWLYTGYTYENIFIFNKDASNKIRQSIIELCDVLVDGQFVESLKDITLKFRGSSNQRLIDVQQTLDKGEVVLWKTE